MSRIALILAAGKGTRMKSALPKVLHPIAGRPMIHYPVRAAVESGVDRVVVVVGHGRAQVEAYLHETFGDRVQTVVQEDQRGTGHAAQIALPTLQRLGGDGSGILILCGDTPAIASEALRALMGLLVRSELALLTTTLANPSGYGRIVRRDGQIVGIREDRDCSEDERKISEINVGIYATTLGLLARELPHLSPNNAQGELYLTDLIARTGDRGALPWLHVAAESVEGVNDRAQLATIDRRMLTSIAHRHQLAGVTIRDAASAEIHDTVTIAEDATIERGVVLRGNTTIGVGAAVDVGCVLTNVIVEAGAILKPYTIATDSTIGARAQVGPFSHLRPASVLGEESHVGNFVELKKTTLGRKSKANHLAYLGDGVVGAEVNIGAGTIFCNYDGFNKHTTTLQDGVFIGSDSQLVAPVTVGEGAYVATGTTVTRDVPADALAIGRVRQENKDGYAKRIRGRMQALKTAVTKKA